MFINPPGPLPDDSEPSQTPSVDALVNEAVSMALAGMLTPLDRARITVRAHVGHLADVFRTYSDGS